MGGRVKIEKNSSSFDPASPLTGTDIAPITKVAKITVDERSFIWEEIVGEQNL